MVKEHAATRSTEASLGCVSLLTLAVVYFWLRASEFDALGIVDHETGTTKRGTSDGLAISAMAEGREVDALCWSCPEMAPQ